MLRQSVAQRTISDRYDRHNYVGGCCQRTGPGINFQSVRLDYCNSISYCVYDMLV